MKEEIPENKKKQFMSQSIPPHMSSIVVFLLWLGCVWLPNEQARWLLFITVYLFILLVKGQDK